LNHSIFILDYGMGNLFSVGKILSKIGCDYRVTSDPEEIANANRIIMPGVGHFGTAMQNMRDLNLLAALNEAALVRKVPILGICLGMQLMASKSEEGDAAGLGWLDASVVRFKMDDSTRFKVPHMGWNTLDAQRPFDPILNGIEIADEFYFVHSYHLVAHQPEDVLTTTDYSYPFVSSVRRNNLVGMQFHPEKSHAAGERLIRNFLTL